jgi:hypothetical protein
MLIACIFSIGLFSTSLVTAQTDESEDFLEVGGALRLNFYHTDYDNSTNPNNTQFTFDTWRINVRGERSGVGIDFEYRFYPTFNTHFIKQGWLYYNFNEHTELQVGVTQVPFGNLQYNSHNWWFQGGYYNGLEDDHDMGFKLTREQGNSTFMLAYFVQPEPSGPAYGSASFGIGGSGRYSYDIIPITGNNPWDYVLGANETPQSNQEKNQFNFRYTYNLKHNSNSNSLLGFSTQLGQVYNIAQDVSDSRTALAAHLNGDYGNFNLKAQVSYSNVNAINDNNEDVDYIYMAAYGDPYPVASEMYLYSLGVSYSWDVDAGPVSNLNFYNDYTFFQKEPEGFNDSHQNVLGVLASLGDVYIYFDVASGLNHPWLTNDFGTGLGQGLSDPRLNTRFNINIGYYF